jgi:hypothetical protein
MVLEDLLLPGNYQRGVWYPLALAQSQLLSRAQREEFCARLQRELDARFHDADSWIDTTWGCGLMGIAASDPQAARERYEEYMKSGRSNDLLMAYALLLYRAGAYADIIDIVTPDYAGVEPILIRALALARSGQPEQAQQAVEKAKTMFDNAQQGKQDLDWNVKLQWDMLVREIEELGLKMPRADNAGLKER